jgi:hypothetical protein
MDLVRETLELADSPRALTVWMLFKYGEHRQLVELGFDPLAYNSVDGLRNAYQATKLLSKCEGLKTGIDTKQVALEAAEAAERQCRETNLRFRRMRAGLERDIRGLDSTLIQRAKAKIARVLGEVPESFRDRGWSPGRSTSAFGDSVSPLGKYKATPHVTVSARRAAIRLLRDCPTWGASVLDADAPCSVLSLDWALVPGNVMLTVPKNAKTDRVICYEPHMNIRLQLMVGGYIRERLRRKAGQDLNDQTINQRRARLGSIDGALATIDLSSASDTLAIEVVYELLPIDWACLLDNLRSAYTTWPTGELRKNEKFSSMGTGFTFELESLIFWAIASAAAGNDVTVYGDDIVVPTRTFSEVSYALEFFGFTVNRSKSYSEGLFRESCGSHYIGGALVTPSFIRRPIRSVGGVVLLHNQVLRWALQPMQGCIERRVHRVLKSWRTRFPAFLGPQGLGDGHYHVNFDDAKPVKAAPLQRSFGWEGWWFQTRTAFTSSALEGPEGEIGTSLGYAAILAAVGPKRVRSLWESHVSRKDVRYKTIRTLATVWPGYWVT